MHDYRNVHCQNNSVVVLLICGIRVTRRFQGIVLLPLVGMVLFNWYGALIFLFYMHMYSCVSMLSIQPLKAAKQLLIHFVGIIHSYPLRISTYLEYFPVEIHVVIILCVSVKIFTSRGSLIIASSVQQ